MKYKMGKLYYQPSAAKLVGYRNFDWRKNLTRDRKIINWDKLFLIANNWATCACGMQTSIILRDDQGVPYDYELRTLGFKFMEAVGHQNNKLALKILDQIEKRSSQLVIESSL